MGKLKKESNQWIVYKHTCNINEKIYVGITQQNPPEKRWLNGLGYQMNSHFWSAIKKYGWDSFSHDILCVNLTQEEAEQKEVYYINLYQSSNRNNGYNIDLGGNAIGRQSEETKAKISKANSGMNHWTYNKTHAEIPTSIPIYNIELDTYYVSAVDASEQLGISKMNIRECCKGNRRIAGNYHWLYAKDVNTDNINEALNRVRGTNSKKILCVELDIIFNSAREAESILKDEYNISVNYKNISSVCIGKREKTGGYHWCFIDKECVA